MSLTFAHSRGNQDNHIDSIRVCILSITAFWSPSANKMLLYTNSAALFIALNADSGYRTMAATPLTQAALYSIILFGQIQ